MVRFLGKKQRCLVLTAYLVFAVMGMFSFAAADSLYFDAFTARPVSGAFFAPLDHGFDCLAVTLTLNKTRGPSFPSLRAGPLRGLAPPETWSAGELSFQSAADAAFELYRRDIKNTILLKLRI